MGREISRNIDVGEQAPEPGEVGFASRPRLRSKRRSDLAHSDGLRSMVAPWGDISRK